MKAKSLEKAVTAAREQARILEDNASQSGRIARDAKDQLRQAKGNLKQAKEEARHARKASRAAKRACTEATAASEAAAAELAALEKRMKPSRARAAPARAKSKKPIRARVRKSAANRPRPRVATADSKKAKPPLVTAVPAAALTGPHTVSIHPDPPHMEVHIQVPSDIAVSTDVFSGNPAQSDGFGLADPETSSP